MKLNKYIVMRGKRIDRKRFEWKPVIRGTYYEIDSLYFGLRCLQRVRVY